MSERGFAGSRRAVEDHAGETVRFEHPPQEFSGPEKMLLADELIERARPHPRRQRRDAVEVLSASVLEEVHRS